jgi:hypothetical protein
MAGPDDTFLAEVGIPAGASARLRDLVAKGLLYEMDQAARREAEMRERIRKMPRRIGRPKRLGLGIDAQRFIHVYCYSQQGDRGTWTDAALIQALKGGEEWRRQNGFVEAAHLLWGTAEETLAQSVSRGRTELTKRAEAEGMNLANWLASLLQESQPNPPT